MASQMAGCINIGGRVTRGQWNRMVELEGYLDKLDPATGKTTEEDTVYLSDGSVTVNDGCASWGHFDELESYLREQGIPYDRQSDAAYEYDAQEASFRPGMDDELTCRGEQNGGIVVPIDRVITYIENKWSLDEIIALGSTLDDEVRLYMLRKSQPLPDFEFIEAEG